MAWNVRMKPFSTDPTNVVANIHDDGFDTANNNNSNNFYVRVLPA